MVHPGGAAAADGRVWQAWRHSRPFWGGLLVILGGTEILLSEKAPLPIIIHIGLQGLAGYLVPAVMVICGLLLLFHPVQQTFYSLLAVLLALGSWITSNLGGFLVGMLLGVIGGSLAFAWQRGQGRPGKRRLPRLRRGPAARLGVIGWNPADAGPEAEGGPEPGKTMGGGMAIVALPLVPLALSVLAAAVPRGPVPAPPLPARTATPTPGPAGSHRPPATTPASPSVTISPATPSTSPSPSPSAVRPPAPGRKNVRHAAAARPPADLASTALSVLTAGSAVLTGLSFDGVAWVPTAAGPVLMLKFSMASMTFSGGIRLLVSQAGHTSLAQESSLGFSGNVALYTTKISGELNGARVTFTPRQPPSGLHADMTFANVATHQLCTTAGSLSASGLLITDG